MNKSSERKKRSLYLIRDTTMIIKTFDGFTQNGVFFFTRLKSNTAYESVKENDIPSCIGDGVIKDEIIRIDVKENGIFLNTLSSGKSLLGR